jgi:hypothetical protein
MGQGKAGVYAPAPALPLPSPRLVFLLRYYAAGNAIAMRVQAPSPAPRPPARAPLLTGVHFVQIISPTDVWLWVQGVDALCLQYLLGDGVEEQQVVDAYKEQFAFGASQRVKVRS